MVDRRRAKLLTIARKQHGAFTRRQAGDAGYSPTEIKRLRARGEWRTLRRGVYAHAGALDSWELRASAAVLAAGPGAALSGRSAAYVLRLLESRPQTIDVTVPFGRRGSNGTHRARSLGETDTRVINGLRVTCGERTLIDLAGSVPVSTLEGALDRGLLAGRFTTRSVRTYVVRRQLTHRPGVGTLMKLLDDREFGIPESELERAFERLIKSEGLPTPVRQRSVSRFRVDYAYLDQNIFIEVDGSATRSTKAALQRDRRRQNEIALELVLILRFTWDDVTRDIPYVVATIRRALDGAGGGS